MNIFNLICKKYGIVYFFNKKTFIKGKSFLLFFSNLESLFLFKDFLDKVFFNKLESYQIINFFFFSLSLKKNISFKIENFLLKKDIKLLEDKEKFLLSFFKIYNYNKIMVTYIFLYNYIKILRLIFTLKDKEKSEI